MDEIREVLASPSGAFPLESVASQEVETEELRRRISQRETLTPVQPHRVRPI